MIKRTSIFVIFLLTLLGLSWIIYYHFYQTDIKQITNYLVFTEFDNHPGLTRLQNHIAPLIDRIIKEEVGAQDDNYPHFIIKKRQNLTLYYLDGFQILHENLLLNALIAMQNRTQGIKAPRAVTISTDSAFFGDRGDELVIKINDPSQALRNVHNDIKETCRVAAAEFKQKYNTNLYDVAKSERFPYVPHSALGRISINALSNYSQKPEEGFVIFQKIKKRIEDEVFPTIKTLLSPEEKVLAIDSFCVFSFRSREVIKKFLLS